MSSAREATLTALEGKRLTRVLGRPTIKSVKKTRKEIAAEYAKAKTTHQDFPLGTRFGFAAAILSSTAYIAAHDKANPDNPLPHDWEFEYPGRPETYDPTAQGGITDATRRKKEANRREIIREWERLDAYETAFKQKIEEAYDSQYLEAIKDDILELSVLTVRDVIDHLGQQCLALTNVEKEAKLEETRLPWDLNDDIQTYFTKLDKLETELEELDIEWPTSMKITQAVKEMYKSNQFEKREYRDWEKKTGEEKTWVHCQTYFTGLFNDNKRFGDTAGNKHGYESAANADETPNDEQKKKDNDFTEELCDNLREVAIAATADKEHLQQMSTTNEDLLGIVKKQQDQITQLIKQNGELTTALAKNTNGNSNNNNNSNRNNNNRNRNNNNNNNNNNNKSNNNDNNNNNENKTENSGAAEFGNYGCKICGKHKYTKDCLELEQNKGRRREGWKSQFA